MPKFHVQKSISINAPAEKIYKTLNNFHHWTAWSPWLIMEPEVKVDVADGGKYYEWEGNRVGSGNMKVTKEQENSTIDYDLHFLKPWKSSSTVRFEIESKGETSQVTWHMDSSLPFFLFWMKKITVAMIGMDYDRGLNMLKEYIEDGKVHSKLDFLGESQFEGCQYVGIKRSTTTDQLGPHMQADFEKLKAFNSANALEYVGYPFSIYHKFDMKNGKAEYTIGYPVKQLPQQLSEGIISGAIPKTKIYKLRHTGPYKHLGNAWSTMYGMHRNKQIKPVRKIHPFELYVSDPSETDEKELITDICFAVK